VLGKAQRQPKNTEMGGVGKDDTGRPVEQQILGYDKTKVNDCNAHTPETPRYEVTSYNIGNCIKYMKDHALIGKFMGIWPFEKSLTGWVSSRWKIKGKVDLYLGSKGFFTTIFVNHVDINKVFDEGPYFFQFSRSSPSLLDGKVFPKEGMFHGCIGLGPIILITARILGDGNIGKHR